MRPDPASQGRSANAGDSSESTAASMPGADGSVRGERGRPLVTTTRSLQSRASSILACALMVILGGAMLTWYYTNVGSRLSRVKRDAQSAAFHKVQGEMPLPALKGFSSFNSAPSEPPPPGADGQSTLTMSPAAPDPLQVPLSQSQSDRWVGGPHSALYGQAPRKSPEAVTQDRLLSGVAFARESGQPDGGGFRTAEGSLALGADGGYARTSNALGGAAVDPGWSEGSIGSLLRPSATASARAKVLPTRRFLLPKGAFIDCTLETAIDSTLPGMTTCITATDTFSADGTVVLLERGTKLIGETRGQAQQGVARVFVLWTEARTPRGVVVPLDSPGADELGRSGLPGTVNRHFWYRFGAAILISTLDGAVQAAVQSASRGGGPIIYNPSSTENVLTDVLKNSINIPPTITKSNGDRIQVFVARDVDFRSVYELRSLAAEP